MRLAQRADTPDGNNIATSAVDFAVAAGDFAFGCPDFGVSCEKGQLEPLLQFRCAWNLQGIVALGPGSVEVFGAAFGFPLGLGFAFGLLP